MSKPSDYDPNNPHNRTFRDRKFHFFNFGTDDIDIEEIAHSLSNLCRYGGHCKQFYSVAEHSIQCYRRSPNESLQLWCLLHDAAEAYIGDITGPLKSLLIIRSPENNQCETISGYEKSILRIIAIKFNLPWPIPKEVYDIDRELLYEEMEALWNKENVTITMSPEEAEQTFLALFKLLDGNKKVIGDYDANEIYKTKNKT